MRKKTICIVTVLLVGITALLYWYFSEQEKQKEDLLSALNAQAQPLETRVWKLQNELASLDEDYQSRTASPATEQLIFLDLDEAVYTEVYPLMRDYQAVGVLALSKEEFPGQAGKITSEQLAEMLADGWTCCLAWDGAEDLLVWLEDMHQLLEQERLTMPDTVYFAENTYFAQADQILTSVGVSVAVHHGETGLPLAAGGPDEEVWHPGCMPWNVSGIMDITDNFILAQQNLAFTVSFISGDSLYTYDAFTEMFAYISEYRQNDGLLITDFQTARACQEDAQKKRAELAEELEAEKEAIKAQILELEEQINAIYAGYDIGN